MEHLGILIVNYHLNSVVVYFRKFYDNLLLNKGTHMKNKILLVTLAFAFLLLQGCATVQMASSEADNAAKAFNATPDKSTIYFFRDEFMGAAVTMDVYLDGQFMGFTGANSYFQWIVDPGEHQIKSVAENDEELKFTTEPGKIYYIWQEVKMGIMSGRNALHIVDEARGKKGVMDSKLIDPSAAEKIMASRKKDGG